VNRFCVSPWFPEVCHHVHRADEYCHRDILCHTEHCMIYEVVYQDRYDRPGEFEDSGDMHGSRLESTIVDVHSDESSRTRDSSEVEPLRARWYTEVSSPLRDDEESRSDDGCCERELHHRDNLWMVILEKVLREVGGCSPCSCRSERVECCCELLLSIRSCRYTMRKCYIVSSDER